jgi:hypothetical protein
MKLIIEEVEGRKAKMTLEFCRQLFSEIWKQHSDTIWVTEGESIIQQLEDANIIAECANIEEFLDNIDVPNFIDLAEYEKNWD